MCGIGGLYNTEYNERDFEDLFWMIADRGMHAAGVAWLPRGKTQVQVQKAPKSSRYLVERGIAKYVGTDNLYVMQHARYTTQGSVKNNNNNHPVLYDNIVLTHNGVIANDDEGLRLLGRARRYEVDTEAVAAGLSLEDVGWVYEHLQGPMALAWVDRNDPEIVNLIRNEFNPLHIARLDDGGVAWSSRPYMMGHLGIADSWEAMPYRLYRLHPDGRIETRDIGENFIE